MIKKILKIFIFIWFFISLISNSFALDAKISLDKNTSDINNPINLRVEISSDEWWEIAITGIKWLENFKKIWQSQSQSSSTQIVVINWQTKQKTTTTVNLNLSLEPQKTWEFEIWPAILKMWTGTIQTNSVKIKITWNKIQWIWIWNKVLPVQKSPHSVSPKGREVEQKDEEKNTDKQEIKTYEIEKNNNELYLFILILILSGIWFYFIIKKETPPLTPPSKGGGQAQKTPLLTKEGLGVVSEIDFEEKKVEIKYPKIDDKDFIKKSEIALREKLKQKFNIKNIDSLTFEEIQENIWNKMDLKDLLDMLNKAKYSNIITDNSKILEKIKEI